jgi:hypothetical protein
MPERQKSALTPESEAGFETEAGIRMHADRRIDSSGLCHSRRDVGTACTLSTGGSGDAVGGGPAQAARLVCNVSPIGQIC